MSKINWRRWLPSNPALVSGVLTSVAFVVSNKLGLHIARDELAPAITSGVAFLVASVVHKPEGRSGPVPEPAAVTLGTLLAHEVKSLVDGQPTLEQSLVRVALAALTPATPAEAVQAVVKAAEQLAQPAAPTFLEPPSTVAPHISQ